MAYYSFEYFCGANVVVRIGNSPVLEAAGISYEARDSKIPLYGYSSRHYDAVAHGQVIVQGNLLVNYVHQDYLYAVIENRNNLFLGTPANLSPTAPSTATTQDFLFVDNAEEAKLVADDLKAQYWPTNEDASQNTYRSSANPFDMAGGINIDVVFGQQSDEVPAGVTNYRLVDVHFTGRGNVIRIDEDVIVESYSFFARDVASLRRL